MPARCPHCGKILTDAEVRSIHSQMIGSRPKPTSAENGKKGGRPKNGKKGGRPKGAKNKPKDGEESSTSEKKI